MKFNKGDVFSVFDLKSLSKFQLFLLGAMGILFEISNGIFDNMTDTQFVNQVGAEGISFMRLFLLMPLIFLTSYLYKTLMYSNRKEIVFYLFMIFFAGALLVYKFILYPFSAILEMDSETASRWAMHMPFLRVPILVGGKWVTSLFMCLYMVYSRVIFGLILWKIADDIVFNKKTLFPLVSVVVVCGNLLGSVVVRFINHHFPHWDQAMDVMTGAIIISLMGICVLYNKINLDLKRHTFIDRKAQKNPVTSPSRSTSLMQSLRFIMTDKVVFFLVMTTFFASSANFVELIWKSEVRLVFPTQSGYSSYMANVGVVRGISSIAIYLLAIHTLKRWRWQWNTGSSTLFLLVATIFYFVSYHFLGKSLEMGGLFLVISPLFFAWMGAFVTVGYQGTEIGMYYPSARLTYDKMTPEQIENGRLGFELLGRNLGGMFFAALIQIALALGSIREIAPILGIILVTVCVLRLLYIYKLGARLKME